MPTLASNFAYFDFAPNKQFVSIHRKEYKQKPSDTFPDAAWTHTDYK